MAQPHQLVVSCALRAKPERAAELLAYLQGLSKASLSEPGCLRYDICVDTVDPASLAIYESYVSPAAFESHKAQQHFKDAMAQFAVMCLESKISVLRPVVWGGKPDTDLSHH
eukprot:m51a1_g2874 hypothetical protein (112) ;mRNA; r:381030-381365